MIEAPQKYPGKRPDDKVVLFIRKHWIKYAILFLFSLVLATILPVFLIFLLYQSQSLLTAEIITVAISVYLLVILAIVLHTFVDYYLDMLIITEDRIICVRQDGFFSQQHDEIHIGNVEEVGVDVKGVLKSAFNYGNLVIHTGSDEAVMTIEDIADPNKIGQKIMRMHQDHIEKHGGSEPKPDHESSND